MSQAQMTLTGRIELTGVPVKGQPQPSGTRFLIQTPHTNGADVEMIGADNSTIYGQAMDLTVTDGIVLPPNSAMEFRIHSLSELVFLGDAGDTVRWLKLAEN